MSSCKALVWLMNIRDLGASLRWLPSQGQDPQLADLLFQTLLSWPRCPLLVKPTVVPAICELTGERLFLISVVPGACVSAIKLASARDSDHISQGMQQLFGLGGESQTTPNTKPHCGSLHGWGSGSMVYARCF